LPGSADRIALQEGKDHLMRNMVTGIEVAADRIALQEANKLEGLFYFDRLFYDAVGVCCNSKCIKNVIAPV